MNSLCVETGCTLTTPLTEDLWRLISFSGLKAPSSLRISTTSRVDSQYYACNLFISPGNPLLLNG